MTVIKNGFIRKVKDITVGSTLILALAGGITACSSEEEADYEEAEVYTKGVKTYIREVSKDEFKIIDEREVAIDSSAAIVTYLNGKQDTLNPTLAKKLIDNDLQNQSSVRHHNPLSSVLLYGGMGYMFARMMGNNNNQYYNARRQYEGQNKSGSSGFYATPKAYESSKSVQENIGRSRTVVSRPAGSRSGFFRGSVRASHSG